MDINTLTNKTIGCAVGVPRSLGPGLLESAYEECFAFELRNAGLHIERQVPAPVVYKDIHLSCGDRIDILVENTEILELKTIDVLAKVVKRNIYLHAVRT